MRPSYQKQFIEPVSENTLEFYQHLPSIQRNMTTLKVKGQTSKLCHPQCVRGNDGCQGWGEQGTIWLGEGCTWQIFKSLSCLLLENDIFQCVATRVTWQSDLKWGAEKVGIFPSWQQDFTAEHDKKGRMFMGFSYSFKKQKATNFNENITSHWFQTHLLWLAKYVRVRWLVQWASNHLSHVWMHLLVCVSVSVYLSVYLCACVCVFIFVFVSVCISVYVSMCLCVFMCLIMWLCFCGIHVSVHESMHVSMYNCEITVLLPLWVMCLLY